MSAVTEETALARPGVGMLLRDLDQAPPSELVDVCSGWLARHVSAQACVLLLADYAEASLEPVASGPDAGVTVTRTTGAGRPAPPRRPPTAFAGNRNRC